MSIMLSIDGLPLALTSKELRTLAEQHGQVIRCWVVTEPGGGASLRFGYIEAATSGEAERIIAGLSGAKLNCNAVNVVIEKTE
jgi:hypothetical protein